MGLREEGGEWLGGDGQLLGKGISSILRFVVLGFDWLGRMIIRRSAYCGCNRQPFIIATA